MGLLEIAVLVAWLAIVICLWTIYQLVAQNGRILLRIEALERHLGDAVGLSSAPYATHGIPGANLDLPLVSADSDEPDGPPGVPVGTVLHDFELPDLDGYQHLRSDWHGRQLLMAFVSPYCRYSRALLTDLASLRASAPPTWPLPVLVSTGSFEENRRLVTRLGLADPFLVQEEMEVGALFEVPATPMAYLVDEDGRTASPLVAGRAAILGLAATSTSGGETPRVEPPSPDLLAAESTPAPINGARFERGLDVGTIVPDFDLPGLDGERVALDRFRGRRLVLVFADPTHTPCGEVAAHLAQLAGADPGLAIVLVARGDAESNRAWAAMHGLTVPIGLQHRWDVSREYGLLATPVAFLVDERGRLDAPAALGADAVVDLAKSALAVDREPSTPGHPMADTGPRFV